ncbi:MAG: hypothetical protein GY705_17890, partial [Bacteroidetes bacterium]|nr:hypothetical protein [Bacteroidota bacterium]
MVIRSIGLVMKSITPSTRDVYNKCWREFQNLVNKFLVSPVSLPVETGHILIYISELFYLSIAPSSIRSKLSGLSFIHKLNGFPDPCKDFLVEKMVCAIKKIKPQQDLRAPLLLHELHYMVDNIPLMGWNLYDALMFKSMFLLAFHALLRPGELTKSDNTLLLQNVHFENDLLVLTFYSFKHHIGQPIQLYVSSTHDKFCPVNAL